MHKDDNGNLIGEDVRLYRDVLVRDSEIGDKSILADDCFVSKSKLGSYVLIERRAMVFNSTIGTCSNIGFNSVVRNCIIGDYTGFAWNVSIGGAQHPKHTLCTRFIAFEKRYDFITEEEEKRIMKDDAFNWYHGDVIVKNDVWGAAGVHIMRGVTIENGAILGAGSVVTHNVGPYEIWAGVPAKKIGQRFSDEVISELLALEWWKWPREVIKKYIKYFQKSVDLELLKELKDQVKTYK